MRIDVWSDVVCPWCYIGKRRLDQALAGVATPIEVVFHSFELDPGAPAHSDLTPEEMLARKYRVPPSQARAMQQRVTAVAAGEGLKFDLDRARPANTFDAHRLIHWAKTHGKGAEMNERLLRAYFTEGERVGDHPTLARLAADVGLDREEAARVLADPKAFADAVRADEARARAIGITGVPFFVIGDRYGVSGAQEASVLRRAIEQALSEQPLVAVAPAGEACDDDGCAVPGTGDR